jgi:hypothetical protein
MAAITTEEAKRRKVYIRKNYTNKTLKQMANELGVKIDCVAQWMKVMKLKKYKK